MLLGLSLVNASQCLADIGYNMALTIAVALNLLVSIGLILLSSKYLFGPAPVDYHAAIIRKNGIEISGSIPALFRVLNTVIGGSFLALGIAIAALTWFAIAHDATWAKVTVASMGLVFGLPSSIGARRVEHSTGVRTPWRPGMAMTLVILLAFGLSLA